MGRVARAVFHGDSANAGWNDHVVHRADVLLWALERCPASSRSAVPARRVAEVGVFLGENAKLLLTRDPSLTWVGIDAYYDSSGPHGADIYGAGAEGLDVMTGAVNNLRPWLGTRAHLFMMESTRKLMMFDEGDQFDMVF